MSQIHSPAPMSPAQWSERDNSNSPRKLAMRDKGKNVEGVAKRKRAMTNGDRPSNSRRRTREPDDEGSDPEDYDPDQPLEERREVSRTLRGLLKTLNENNDEYLQPDSTGLHETLERANNLSSHVKQTTEATVDARVLVTAGDASYRKAVRLVSGNIAQGVDVDEFVSKCIGYMRLGGGVEEDDAPELSSTQRQRRTANAAEDDEDEIGDEGDMFNWEHLGRFACLPQIRRPATVGFLLGPLSVEKKARKIAKRTAPFRPGNLRETRPEVLDAEDVRRNENNDLSATCGRILKRLEEVQTQAQDEAEIAFEKSERGEIDAAETDRIMDAWGLRDTGGIDLMKFVVNPRSFGQTVENLFYVSFLIRDAKIKMEYDEHGRPTLAPVDIEERETTLPKHAAQKQQAIFHLDFATWRDIIDAFQIKKSLIEHRIEKDSQGPGARGWYG